MITQLKHKHPVTLLKNIPLENTLQIIIISQISLTEETIIELLY